MFNRTIQLDVVKKVKKNRNQELEEAGYNAYEIADMVNQTAYNACFLAVKVIGSYMIFDTIRKIAVNRLSK